MGKTYNLAKWLIVVAAYVYLVYKLLTFSQYPDLVEQCRNVTLSRLWWLVGIVALLPLNWLLEAVKWQRLTANVQSLSLFTSIKAVLAGISTGFFTPNRVGELVGRVMFLSEDNRKSGVTLSLVNSLTQNLIMALCGLPACLLFFTQTVGAVEMNTTYYLLFVIAFLVFFGLFYFALPRLSRKFKSNRFAQVILPFTDCLTGYSFRQLTGIMLISLVRYLVFCVQFFFMLRFFDVHLAPWQALISIPTTYLFVTFTPSFAFSEAAVRSSYAVLVIGAFSGQVVSIALAGLCIWLINFVIPMLVGSVVMVRKK